MTDLPITQIYMIHEWSDGGKLAEAIIDNNCADVAVRAADIVERMKLAGINLYGVRLMLPQLEWRCLRGALDYETGISWCKDRLEHADIVWFPQTRMVPRLGLDPETDAAWFCRVTRGVALELSWARYDFHKEPLLETDRVIKEVLKLQNEDSQEG